MKHTCLATACLSLLALSALPAMAQPVEAVPLSAPSYTLQNETDPMAMDPSSVPSGEKSVNRGEALIAPPPPGLDDQTRAQYETPAPLSPADSAWPEASSPASNPAMPPAPHEERTVPAYPNNTVSGVVPVDESKFANRIFCTLKLSFSDSGIGIDHKTAERVKTYLDANTDKLSYKTTTWGKKGEFAYCLDVPAHNQRARIYTALKKFLPDKDSRDRRTSLEGEGFTQVRTSN